ncbi:MAG: insulinase family protein, partial [Lachnospiraceae bacterium]|nr:insulinase family protein [Lachnospiraceae bacterium]
MGVVRTYEEIALDAYRLEQSEYLEDISCMGFVLRHKKSGARVCVLSCDDNNKVFNIGFRTTPEDNTGVAHIIEHTVLCGSDRYPVKDPFSEMSKASLSTFMNAMTYPDKTVYPVASCNDKDFKNLMGVYLDAVFHPRIYSNKLTFLQEGWHYELEEDGPLTINGVVYSEMKGVYSDPNELLQTLVMNNLFPDTLYSVDSGGVPRHIPELTYEAFLDFHRLYYHPSNSYIFLYGDMDVKERLEFLDREYLSDYEALPKEEIERTRIALQKPFGVKSMEAFYNLSEDADEKNRAFLTASFCVGESSDIETVLGFQALKKVLFDMQGAPVKQALTDAKIGEDNMTSFYDDIRIPTFTVIARNAEAEDMPAFISTIRKTLEEQVEKGIDKKALLGALKSYEFSYREANFGTEPKGLIYSLSILTTWLHDETKVFDEMKLSKHFESLKSKIDSGYFEELVKKYLLGSEHALCLVMKPRKGMLAREDRELGEKLENMRKTMSPDQRKAIADEYKALREFQETVDSKEALGTIPHLSIADLKSDIEPIEYSVEKVLGRELVFTPARSLGIAYFAAFFDLGDLDDEEICYIALMNLLLGSISTEKRGYFELSKEIDLCSGGMHMDLTSYGRVGESDTYRPQIFLSGKALYGDLERALEIAEEILTLSKLSDEVRVKELVTMIKSRVQMFVQTRGFVVAATRATSKMTSARRLKELAGGYSFYRFMLDIYERFDTDWDEILGRLEAVYRKLFARERLMFHVTAEPEVKEDIIKRFEAFTKAIPEIGAFAGSEGRRYAQEPKREALSGSDMVSYVVKAANFLKAGFKYNGHLAVLVQILENSYLYEKVRLEGGAYGAMCGFSNMDGTCFLGSYRDPQLKKTLEVYEALPEFIEKFDADEEEMTGYIIGTIGATEAVLTPSMRGARAFQAYMTGLGEEQLKKNRAEIVSMTVEDIRALADLARTVASGSNLCVAGSEKAI